MIAASTTAKGSWRRHREVLVALTIADLKAMDELSVGGVLRWALEPVSFMLVYFVMIGEILERRQPSFLLFLLCALVPWRYFTSVTTGAADVLRAHGEEIANCAFPKLVLPIVVVVVEGLTLLVSLVLFAPFMALYGIGASAALLWLPVLVAVLAVLVTGPAYVMTLAGLYFPDYRGIVGNMIRAGFFASTGLVPADSVDNEGLRTLLRLNPLSGVFDSFRTVVMAGRSPEAVDVLYPLVVGTVACAGGVWLFTRRQHEFAKEV